MKTEKQITARRNAFERKTKALMKRGRALEVMKYDPENAEQKEIQVELAWRLPELRAMDWVLA